MPLKPENYQFIQEFARQSAAIVLEPGKEYLVKSRLTPIAKQAGFATLNEFIHQLRTNPQGTMFHDQVIDALTTNETSFFRDFYPFELLRQVVIPQLIQQRAPMRKLSIWSAASSTGQEPYTIAMVLKEHFPELAGWNVQILATDLSPTVLDRARVGAYSQLEVTRGLPAPFLLKYFTKIDTKWVIKDEVKKLVEFRQMNLVKPWPILPLFDIIFIRNVMIYFDVESKKSILNRIRGTLQPNGYLFLGTSETTLNLDPGWNSQHVAKATFYQPLPTKIGLPLAA